MDAERLLERIRSVEREPHRGAGNQSRCVESVLSHLQRLLNTRQGNVPIAADYGVPDFLHFLQTHPESVHEIERSLKNCIDKYEPRLSGASVTYLPDQDETLTLRFQIIAGLTTQNGRKVYFETLVDTDGRKHVRR